MDELQSLLGTYIAALERGRTTASPKERVDYDQRLAAAAAIGAALQRRDAKELKRLVDQEERAAGWGFLVGKDGAAAEAALTQFVYRARMSGATFAA